MGMTDDRVIIKLATDFAHIHYVDIDTSHFSGNEAPESSVFGITLSEEELKLGHNVKINSKDSRWTEILPVTGLGPNSRHVFELGAEGKEGKWSALMVRMIPDGGMVCPSFRLYADDRQDSEHMDKFHLLDPTQPFQAQKYLLSTSVPLSSLPPSLLVPMPTSLLLRT
jgi:allantoicase